MAGANRTPPRRQVQDRRGLVFGRLTVIGPWSKRGQRIFWLCQCECGNTKHVSWQNLNTGNTTSCGCRLHAGKHRMCKRPEYHIWQGIIYRCENHNAREYKHYGGRGITICASWRNSFESFLNDVGPRPSADHSIDRIDNDGHYEPGNVRWATTIEQLRNQRRNRLIFHDGETLTLAEWSERTGLGTRTIAYRLRAGWAEDRLFLPSSRPKQPLP